MTEQEIKEFWEKLGFKWANIRWDYHYERGQRVADWLYPDGTFHRDLPSLTGIETLGNLFKWAVPKVRSIWLQSGEDGQFFCQALLGDIRSNLVINKDPAIALFRAIQQVIKEHHPEKVRGE